MTRYAKSALAILACCFTLGATALAQQSTPVATGVIAGRVTDASTLEPRIGASVSVVGTQRGALVDSVGRFVIPAMPVGSALLRTRMLGYKSAEQAVIVQAGDTTRVEFSLIPEATVLGAMRTEARPVERDLFESQPNIGTVTITARARQGVPKVGEPDILRVVQLLPGVEARNDFSTGLNVRGGESDQNLILLDGYPIYNPFHLGGLFSTFIDPTVSGITLMTGGFPAEYGGRLSGVLDVHSAEEERTGVHGTADLSLLAATGSVGGAFAGGRGSWMFAGRRTYADKFIDLISSQELPYHFRDEQAHVTYALTPSTRLALTVYDGSDALDANIASFGDTASANASGGGFDFDWGNRVIGGSLSKTLKGLNRSGFDRRLVGDSTVFEQRASLSDFKTTLDLGEGSLHLRNAISDRRIAGSITTHTERHKRSIGYDAASYRVDYEAVSQDASTSVYDLHQSPTSAALYANDLWRISPRFMLSTGVRAESVRDQGWTVSPRASAKFFVTKDWAATAAVGRFSQWTHSLIREDIPVRLFDFWVASDSVTPVSTAWHYILGTEGWLSPSRYLRIEGFYKQYHNLLEGNPQEDPARPGDEFSVVNGHSYGADLLLRQFEVGRFSGWLSYTYTLSSRQLDALTYFPAHDRRHNVNLVGTWRVSKYVLGARYGFATGTPYTNIVGEMVRRIYDPGTNMYGTRGSGMQVQFIGGTRNGARLPNTQRIDLDVTRTYQWRGMTIAPFLSVVNASAAKNVFVYIFDYSKSPPTRQAISQFPFLPSAGVSVHF